MSDLVQSTIDGNVMVIQFNRPSHKNALTIAMYEAVNEAMAQAAADPAVRAVLLRGDENCFTAGNDLVDFMQNPPQGMDTPVFRFIRALPAFEKPLIAAVAGPAVGIGVTMLLHCDIVYAADNAKLKLPFVSLGLVPEAASTKLLPEMLGYTAAAELLLLGETLNAERAHELRLVTGVCTSDTLLDKAMEAARRVAAQPPAAVRLTKQMLRRHQGNSIDETIVYEGGEFAKRLLSPEAQEALGAFMQKRTPDFSKFE